MGLLLQDFRYGLRAFLRTPGFSLVAVLVLALGIGVNSAMVRLFRPLVRRAGNEDGIDEEGGESYKLQRSKLSYQLIIAEAPEGAAVLNL